MRKCTIEHCGKKHKARGLCDSHYAYFRKLGTLADAYGCSMKSRPRGMTKERLALWALRQSVPDSSGCHLWRGQHNGLGYGQLTVARKNILIHRLVYSLCNGPIGTGMVIRHTCDTPACISPSHLIIGTHTDNARDRVERGQQAVGSRHGMSKLSPEDVREIRKLVTDGDITQLEIANRYGVSRATIYKIVNGLRWSHVR